MGPPVLVQAPVFVLQIETAVDDCPLVEMRGEQICRNNRAVHGG